MQQRFMTPKRPHGVVAGYWGRPGEYGRPATFSPVGQFRWGPASLRAECWELFPSLKLARELGADPCGSCFPREQGRMER